MHEATPHPSSAHCVAPQNVDCYCVFAEPWYVILGPVCMALFCCVTSGRPERADAVASSQRTSGERMASITACCGMHASPALRYRISCAVAGQVPVIHPPLSEMSFDVMDWDRMSDHDPLGHVRHRCSADMAGRWLACLRQAC